MPAESAETAKPPQSDLSFMYEALALSLRASPWPNPRVGAVLVKVGQIIGIGYHAKRGSPHAEKIAISSVKNKKLLKGATLYVTLEPCCHPKGTRGKLTHPCVPAISKAGISRVVIGMKDPNPAVSGRGMRRLRVAGIQVRVSGAALQKEIAQTLLPYLKLVRTGMPYVTLKCAASLDGKLATSSGDSKWLSSRQSRIHAHKLRAENDAILVGINTVLRDNPHLTVRLVKGKNPLRIVLDPSLKIPLTSNVLAGPSAPPVIITTSKSIKSKSRQKKISYLLSKGCMFISAGRDKINLRFALESLAAEGISTLLVEGGGKTISSFLEQGLGDQLILFLTPWLIGRDGVGFADFMSAARLRNALKLKSLSCMPLGDDILVWGALGEFAASG